MKQPTPSHWLQAVAARAGLELPVPPDPDPVTLREAWAQAAAAWKITEEEFARRAATQFKVPLADLSARDPQALRFLPRVTCERFGVLPLKVTDSGILVATSDPYHREARREIEMASGRKPAFAIAGPRALGRVIEEAFALGVSPPDLFRALAQEASRPDFQIVTSDGQGRVTNLELDSPAVMKLSDTVLHQALRLEASELHLEPGTGTGRIRVRMDGVMQDLVDIPLEAHQRLAARLKYQATGGGGGESVIPVRDETGKDWEARLSSSQTPHGELLVLRLVGLGRRPELAEMGFTASAAEAIGRLMTERYGLVLVVGLAQAGKSTLIQASLRALDKAKVVSLENPVEAVIPGVTQIAYDPSGGLSFAETLQGLLDQNPEVIHAGEIRDLATARIALRAALTGRKVLATLHAPDVVAGIRRLLDMGVAPGRLAESLTGVVALRLVRRLCPDCSRPFDPQAPGNGRELMLAQTCAVVPPREAVGCTRCWNTGFRGQLPIAEVLTLGLETRPVLSAGPTDRQMEQACRREGVPSLVAGALERVRSGETTLGEVERALGFLPRAEETPASPGPVLVVDDEAGDRLVVGAVLGSMGLEVVEAEDGPGALALLETLRPSLMILDLGLPGLPGREVLTRVRAADATRTLPVIVLTASPRPEDEVALLDEGADDYVLKPVMKTRLEARVRAVLRRSGLAVPGGG